MEVAESDISNLEKREALESVLSSKTFERSAQLRAFLRYVCERELAGRLEELTEYQIAVNVLGRGKDFNLTDDSSVRNRAYELRQRLEKLYSREMLHAAVRIEIPRGSYVPCYLRQRHADSEIDRIPEAAIPAAPRSWRSPHGIAVAAALAGLAIGAALPLLLDRSHPPGIVKEAWGPLAQPGDDLLVSIATNLHMLVRPHIAPHPNRLPAPGGLYSLYGSARPLQPGTPLFMEPAQLSVPLAEATAIATLCATRVAFGGGYQILPESEAPVAALRGRNSVLIGSGTNSTAAVVLLRNLPLTIDYTPSEKFAVIDQREPPGKNELFVVQPTGELVPSVQYGLLSVMTSANSAGRPTRTLVISGAASAGVQAAAEFFCSSARMREMKERFRAAGLKTFPPNYQIVVRCKTVGLRLLSYEYVTHVVAGRAPE